MHPHTSCLQTPSKLHHFLKTTCLSFHFLPAPETFFPFQETRLPSRLPKSARGHSVGVATGRALCKTRSNMSERKQNRSGPFFSCVTRIRLHISEDFFGFQLLLDPGVSGVYVCVCVWGGGAARVKLEAG